MKGSVRHSLTSLRWLVLQLLPSGSNRRASTSMTSKGLLPLSCLAPWSREQALRPGRAADVTPPPPCLPGWLPPRSRATASEGEPVLVTL